MRRRMGRPGLMGTMARTAVIAGTATAVSGSMRAHQQAGAQQQQQAQAYQAEQQAAAAQQQVAAAQAAQQQVTTPQDDTIAQLTKLGELKSAGILSDAEFSAAKAKLLGI